MFIPVNRLEDPRLRQFAQLRDSQLRSRFEQERGIFVAEGEKIIQRALARGIQPTAFLLTERWLASLKALIPGDVPCFVADEALIERISGFHVHRGALATFVRPEEASWEMLASQDRLLVCEGLVDHANVGSIMRIAAALGWGGVVVSKASADPLYRRAVKTSMGAALQVPWRRMSDDLADLERLSHAGFTLLAATPAKDAVALDDVQISGKVAVLLGNEGHGLPSSWCGMAHQRVVIPMAGGVDSLNVAAAAAILAYELRSSLRISSLSTVG